MSSITFSGHSKSKLLIAITSLVASSLAHAGYEFLDDYLCGHQFAVQSAIATGGNFGIGIVDYTQTTEIGFTISGSSNDAPFETKRVTPVLFAGLRNALCENTYFAWGAALNKTFGTINGLHVDSDIQAGVYVSLEQMLTNHFMLVGWIQPYQYEYRKLADVGVTTNQYFSTGGLGISYLF